MALPPQVAVLVQLPETLAVLGAALAEETAANAIRKVSSGRNSLVFMFVWMRRLIWVVIRFRDFGSEMELAVKWGKLRRLADAKKRRPAKMFEVVGFMAFSLGRATLPNRN
jgi:hypothetical protein